MQLKIPIEIESPQLPADYRRLIMSLMKHALFAYGGNALVDNYYSTAASKPMTWGLYLPSPRFGQDKITLGENRLILTISTDSLGLFGDYYNGFTKIAHQARSISGVTFTPGVCAVPRETSVCASPVWIKLLSPLAVRRRSFCSEKEEYETFDSPNFLPQLKEVIQLQLARAGKEPALAETLSIDNASALRRTVIFHYERFIPVTIGRALLSGDAALLEWLRLVGMGSHRNAGCGMFCVMAAGGR